MDAIDINKDESFKWLRYALNPEADMPQITDWSALMAFAERQALTGLLLPVEPSENIRKDLLLRQVVDYYYVLRNLEVTEKERAELVGVIKSLGLYRFAKAVMWDENGYQAYGE